MKLSTLIRPEMIWPDLVAKTKQEVIGELAGNLARIDKSLDERCLAQILEERERLGSTGIQDGIAIPHGKVPRLENLVIACGRSRCGIDFNAHDQKPTHLFFVLLAPEFAAGQHLKVLARLSRLLKEAHFRENLMAAEDANDMYRAIIEEDEKI